MKRQIYRSYHRLFSFIRDFRTHAHKYVPKEKIILFIHEFLLHCCLFRSVLYNIYKREDSKKKKDYRC